MNSHGSDTFYFCNTTESKIKKNQFARSAAEIRTQELEVSPRKLRNSSRVTNPPCLCADDVADSEGKTKKRKKKKGKKRREKGGKKIDGRRSGTLIRVIGNPVASGRSRLSGGHDISIRKQ